MGNQYCSSFKKNSCTTLNIVPLTLAVASKDMAESTENWDVTYEKKAVNQTTYNFFTKFHESCSTGFRRCVSTESCDSGTFLEADTAKYLIKELAKDSRKSYVVVSADQTEKNHGKFFQSEIQQL